MSDYALNSRTAVFLEQQIPRLADLGAALHMVGHTKVIDAGVRACGSLAAGELLARACLADRAVVSTSLDRLSDSPCPRVTVNVTDPTVACLLSQYAGWKLSDGKFFAMASGPMRALIAREPLFDKLGYRESADVAVGILETRTLPDAPVIDKVARATGVAPERIILLAARTSSLAGGYQIVARSVETCLHKLMELGFDVTRVRSAIGSAFVPPVAKDDLVAIGRTNDSILYGAEVCLWVDGDEESIHRFGPRVPAAASSDYGAPFVELFKRCNGDFYAIDPLLFSPAKVVFNHLETGLCLEFGRLDTALLARSFFC